MSVEENVSPINLLTKEFLENVLKRKIVSHKVSGGSKPGDNYTGAVISLEIVVEDGKEPLHLVYKTFPFHPARQKPLEETNYFLKEYQVYDIWLQELIKFQKASHPNEETMVPAMPELVAGAAIDYSGNPDEWKKLDPILGNFILMVDVRRTYGFKMADKLTSLTLPHVKLVMDELAKYQAIGHAYKIHNKLSSIRSRFPFLKDYFYGIPSQQAIVDDMMMGGLQAVMDSCKDFLDENPEIVQSLSQFKDSPDVALEYLAMFTDRDGVDEEKVEGFLRSKPKEYSNDPLKDQWIVVGHGDLWTNNILFKTDDGGNVSGAIILDLSEARECCIMVDLVYFFYTSTDTNFRKQYLDQALKWYHERFIHYCGILKVDPFPGFTWENFQRKFHRSKILGFVFAALILPILLERPENAVNLDAVLEGNKDSGGDGYAAMFRDGRKKEDEQLLGDRVSALFQELHEEGVL